MCDTPIANSTAVATAYLKGITAFAESWPAVMCKVWIKISGTTTYQAWTDVGPDDIVVFPDSYTKCTVVDKWATFTADAAGTITTASNATSILTVAMVMMMLVIMLVQMLW